MAAILALLLQGGAEVKQGVVLDDGTLVLETTLDATAQVAETDRGYGDVLWAAPGFTAVAVPEGAGWVRLSGAGRTTGEFPVDAARRVEFGAAVASTRVAPARTGFEVENAQAAPLVVLVRRLDRTRFSRPFQAAYLVPGTGLRSVDVPGGSEAVLLRVQDAAGSRHEKPPERIEPRPLEGKIESPGDIDLGAVSARVSALFGRDVTIRLPDLRMISGGVLARLEYEELNLRGVGLGLMADVDLFRLSLDAFRGDWEGDAHLTIDDGVTVTRSDASIEGDFFGTRVGLFWPALQYRMADSELAFGAAGGFHWLRLNLKETDGEPFELDETRTVVAGSVGPRFSILFRLGRGEIRAEGGGEYFFGDLEGLGGQVTFGYAIRF